MGDAGSGNSQNAYKLHRNRGHKVIILVYLYYLNHLSAQALVPQTCH